MSESSREGIPWVTVTYTDVDPDTDLEARIRYRHDVENGWMDFEGFIGEDIYAFEGFPGAEDVHGPEPTFSGFIKWDGCANYVVGENTMYHTCHPRDLADLATAMGKVYERAAEVMPNWIGET